LNVFQQANKPAKVLEYWERLMEFAEHNAGNKARQPNVRSYTIMLQMYLKQKAYNEATELWKNIPSSLKNSPEAGQLRDMMMTILKLSGLGQKALDVYNDTIDQVQLSDQSIGDYIRDPIFLL
jgi:hypothetical protein